MGAQGREPPAAQDAPLQAPHAGAGGTRIAAGAGRGAAPLPLLAQGREPQAAERAGRGGAAGQSASAPDCLPALAAPASRVGWESRRCGRFSCWRGRRRERRFASREQSAGARWPAGPSGAAPACPRSAKGVAGCRQARSGPARASRLERLRRNGGCRRRSRRWQGLAARNDWPEWRAPLGSASGVRLEQAARPREASPPEPDGGGRLIARRWRNRKRLGRLARERRRRGRGRSPWRVCRRTGAGGPAGLP